MAWKLELIDQGDALRRHARTRSKGANEAYLAVHDVIARKFAQGAASDPSACVELSAALSRADAAAARAA